MYLATSLSLSTFSLSLTYPTSVTSGETIQRRSSIIHVLHKINKLCKNNTIITNLLTWDDLLTCHHLTLSLTGFAVGSIEYSLCNFRQLGNFQWTIPECTHSSLPDTVSDRVCRWLDRVFPMKLWAVGIIPINNPQICSLAIVRHSLWQELPLARSSILSAALGNLVNSESIFIHMFNVIARHCLPQCLPLPRSGILSAALFSLVT